MTLRPTSSAKHAKDGRTIFSMSRLRSAGSAAAQPRGSSRRAKAVNFLTERGLEQQASIRLVLEVLAGSLSLLHNRLRREHALCSSLRSEHAGEELRCWRWGLHRWRARQADHACTIAKTRAANIAASSATKKGGGAWKEWPFSIPDDVFKY